MSSEDIPSACVRHDRNSAMTFIRKTPLGPLMKMAHEVRRTKFPSDIVTFVCDTNPNYTNVCVTACEFCAFYRKPSDPKGYTLSSDEIAEKVLKSHKMGATTVLLQGGHNPLVRLRDWIDYIRAIQKACPHIHIHPFSPAEYLFMSRTERMSVREVLEVVYHEGIRTIPGGGAEILTESVRSKIAPLKATSDQWLAVSRTAHEVGFKTTATMMFGHVERDEDIVEHLLKIRNLQDETNGFSSFIAWSFKKSGSRLGEIIDQHAHPAKYIRVVALSRLLLDNFDHIQSSWFSESVSQGQLGLMAGADDFGGVLIEENVLSEAGHKHRISVEEIKTIIRRAGFIPAERNAHYEVQRIFSD